jgi:hypothetical protein
MGVLGSVVGLLGGPGRRVLSNDRCLADGCLIPNSHARDILGLLKQA